MRPIVCLILLASLLTCRVLDAAEADVATGQWSSPKARQRVLVNQATEQRPKVSASRQSERASVRFGREQPDASAFRLISQGDSSASQKADAKKNAPNNVLAPIQDVPGLPRVLLIGDSISMGYTLPVRKLLEGKANVHRIPVNGGPTKNGIANIDKWLGDSKWDVIHFNWGIHDLKYMPDEKRQVEPADYEKNLRSLVAKMKGTGAKLIWCSTTPIPDGELNPPRRFGQVKEYNDIAGRVMSENGVLVNELNAHITPEFDRLHTPKDLHYSREGSEFLAKKVAAEIEKALARQIPKP